MGAGISLLGDFEKAALLAVAGINLVVVVQLFAKGSSTYLQHIPTKPQSCSKKAYTDARMRLNAFWMIGLIFAVAAALKLVLPESLADQIIAAWFVGQGFALQRYVKSFLSGMQVRSNSKIWPLMFSSGTKPDEIEIHYEQCKSDFAYQLHDQTILSFTLKTSSNDTGDVYRVLPWTAMDSVYISCKKMHNA